MLLIKNVKVVDGGGQEAKSADVLISGDKISAIGNFPDKKAETVIEGLGGYLTPGFIDVSTDADHYLTLFTNPSQDNFLKQGVTTIIGGHCGSSLAPLLYGSLESIRKWANPNQINIDWQTFEEFLAAISRLPLGVNFGTLIGHSTIRRALIGEDLRDLTEKEIKVFKEIVEESLRAGALGFSTGLAYAHSRQTPYQEIKSFVSLLPKYNAAYTTHLRDERAAVYNSVNETLQLYKETGAKTVISHFRPIIGYEKNFEAALGLIEKSSSKMDFHFDIYPFTTSIVPLYILLPEWAQRGGLETMLELLQNPGCQKRVIKELPPFKNGELTIAQSPTNPFLEGKTVTKKELVDLMLATRLRALLFHQNISPTHLEKIISSDKALIGSNSGGLGERAISTFPRFLELAGKQKKYKFEKAIKKITGDAAAKFNLKERGLIKEGYFADLVLIINNKIQAVVINGQTAVRNGQWQKITAGSVLVRNS